MWTEVRSPIGPIRLTEVGNALTGVFMLKHKYGPAGFPDEERGDSTLLREGAKQLTAYFEGTLREFDLPLDRWAATSSARSGMSSAGSRSARPPATWRSRSGSATHDASAP